MKKPPQTLVQRMRGRDSAKPPVYNPNNPRLFSICPLALDLNNKSRISHAGELNILDELGITSISTAQTLVSQPTANGNSNSNSIVATGSLIRNGQQQYVADIEFAYDPALTDANPNRPLDLPPTLDSDVYQLPWLRGYGEVKSLPLSYQQDPTVKQAASDLIAQGTTGILQNFEGFMVKWTGLEAEHACLSRMERGAA